MVKFRILNHGFSLFLFMLVFQSPICDWGVDARRTQSTEDAYVTLLYGDEFVLGVRVLGKSIRDTGSKKDMVVLVSDGVSDYAKTLLEADGWIIEKISLLENPNRIRPTRFWGVYTKLKIFNMTNYRKVVYLDADTIVIKSIEDLFKCGKFCANLKHSERLNSGVLVVEPSRTLFNDMLRKVSTLPSYTGGDQGFLNSYYGGFADAHLFNPNLSSEELKSRPTPEMERLSTLYNADVGLYMLANKWMVDEKELHVIHYTLGPLKPWDWYTAWLVKPVDLWQDIRLTIEESLPGTGGGRNPQDELWVKVLFLLPFLGLIFFYYRSFLQVFESFGLLCRASMCDRMRHLALRFRTCTLHPFATVSPSSALNSNQQFYSGLLSKVPWFLGGMSISVCLLSAVVALGLAFLMVPRQVLPWTGLVLMYEWTFTLFFLLFGGYLRLVYQWGKIKATQAALYSSDPESLDYDYRKGHQRQVSSYDAAVLYYGLGMAFLAIIAPLLPYLLGITALFVRLGLMVVGGIVLATFMAYASEHLAIQSYIKGLED
ncbi:inositol phosphorylceramide glucuronosyltransferase 1 [Amaranthus tricolor]|uniref:inositol phosphorylceramide glucuronosyltransferase 1 n=1 Tax=Amaranthus tricolor TaxID=29722 RepID=UPI00258A9E2B|nr:inositol phosphorylceramide glucuronosyltransferase 1 [Amaranthus tricolor]